MARRAGCQRQRTEDGAEFDRSGRLHGVVPDTSGIREAEADQRRPLALVLQSAAGNRAVATLVRSGHRGAAHAAGPLVLLSAVPPLPTGSSQHLQRLFVQRNGKDGEEATGRGSDDPEGQDAKAESAEKQVEAKAKTSGSPGQVPEKAGSADQELAATIADASVRKGTLSPDTAAELKTKAMPKLIAHFNGEADRYAGMPPEERQKLGEESAKGPEGEGDDVDTKISSIIDALTSSSAHTQSSASTAAHKGETPEKEEAPDEAQEQDKAHEDDKAQDDDSEEEEEEERTEAIESATWSETDDLAKAAEVKPKLTGGDDVDKATDGLERFVSGLNPATWKEQTFAAIDGSQPPTAPRKSKARRVWDKIRKVVKGVDDALGPGPEATPSALPASVGTITGPLGEKTDKGGLGMLGAPEASMGGTIAAGGLDFFGNMARLWQGVERIVAGMRGHKGRRRFTCKDTRQGLGAVGQGAAGAALNLVAVLKTPIEAASKFGELVAGPISGGVGAVLSFITAARAFRQTLRASKRAVKARVWERSIKQWKKDPRMGVAPQEQQNQDAGFLARLAGVVRKVRKKAERKSTRKFFGGAFAMIGGVGAIFLIVGTVTAANIWNPVGWTLGGIALGGAIALGLWRLWRWYERRENREAELGNTMGKGGVHGSNKDDIKWILAELDCGTPATKHLNATGHSNAISRFLTDVLGKDPQKARSRGEPYLAGKFKSW